MNTDYIPPAANRIPCAWSPSPGVFCGYRATHVVCDSDGEHSIHVCGQHAEKYLADARWTVKEIFSAPKNSLARYTEKSALVKADKILEGAQDYLRGDCVLAPIRKNIAVRLKQIYDAEAKRDSVGSEEEQVIKMVARNTAITQCIEAAIKVGREWEREHPYQKCGWGFIVNQLKMLRD